MISDMLNIDGNVFGVVCIADELIVRMSELLSPRLASSRRFSN